MVSLKKERKEKAFLKLLFMTPKSTDQLDIGYFPSTHLRNENSPGPPDPHTFLLLVPWHLNPVPEH